MARLRERAGDLEGAKHALLQVINTGDLSAYTVLVSLLRKRGQDRHERLCGLRADGDLEEPWW
ncbi:hypothetical protein GCM10020367_05350 [Streptomyces sannanensis]|uniref:Uncharacterized protein n=1 Tax=Streptomyces sannanensis TaxID=285536 RepID=A0ABP6S511_9ACTN